jgi:molybdopterin converting factor subunit 1
MERRVTLLYFAAIADLVRSRQEALTLPADVRDVRELYIYLEHTHPTLLGRLAVVRCAVNERFVDADHTLADGDTVALIPPVSGG